MKAADLPPEVARLLTPGDYATVRGLLHARSGIELGAGKQTLVYSRLIGRLQATACSSFSAYLQHLSNAQYKPEQDLAIELLTTNETYFYREPEQFERFREHAREAARQRGVLKVWSAACSSGEEAYTLGMVLQAEVEAGLNLRWDILATDLSLRMLEQGRRAVYPDARVTQLPEPLRKRFCLRGTGPAAGTVLIDKALRERVSWCGLNLVEPLPDIGSFDVIFLRNVLIYFDRDTKRRVVQSLARALRPDGLLFVGQADGLLGLTDGLYSVAAGVYRQDRRSRERC